jgi:hypothetical protein
MGDESTHVMSARNAERFVAMLPETEPNSELAQAARRYKKSHS